MPTSQRRKGCFEIYCSELAPLSGITSTADTSHTEFTEFLSDEIFSPANLHIYFTFPVQSMFSACSNSYWSSLCFLSLFACGLKIPCRETGIFSSMSRIQDQKEDCLSRDWRIWLSFLFFFWQIIRLCSEIPLIW